MKTYEWILFLILFCVPLACTKSGSGPGQTSLVTPAITLDPRVTQAGSEDAAIREMKLLRKELEKEQELDE